MQNQKIRYEAGGRIADALGNQHEVGSTGGAGATKMVVLMAESEAGKIRWLSALDAAFAPA